MMSQTPNLLAQLELTLVQQLIEQYGIFGGLLILGVGMFAVSWYRMDKLAAKSANTAEDSRKADIATRQVVDKIAVESVEKLDELHDQIAILQKDHAATKLELATERGRVQELSTRAIADNDRWDKKQDELRKEIDNSRKEIDNLSQQMKRHEERIKELESQLAERDNQLNALKSEKDVIVKANEELKLRIKQLEDDIALKTSEIEAIKAKENHSVIEVVETTSIKVEEKKEDKPNETSL